MNSSTKHVTQCGCCFNKSQNPVAFRITLLYQFTEVCQHSFDYNPSADGGWVAIAVILFLKSASTGPCAVVALYCKVYVDGYTWSQKQWQTFRHRHRPSNWLSDDGISVTLTWTDPCRFTDLESIIKAYRYSCSISIRPSSGLWLSLCNTLILFVFSHFIVHLLLCMG